jgi:hypothetical protein
MSCKLVQNFVRTFNAGFLIYGAANTLVKSSRPTKYFSVYAQLNTASHHEKTIINLVNSREGEKNI